MKSFIAWLLDVDPQVLGPDAEISYRFNQQVEGWVVFLLAAGAIGFTTWVYRRDGRGTASGLFRCCLGFLRIALIAIALLMLTEPVLVSSHNEKRPSTVLVLVDRSFSMKLTFPYAEDALRRQVQEALGKDLQIKVLDEEGKAETVPVAKLSLSHFGRISRMQVVCQALRKGAPGFLDELKKRHPQVKLYTFDRELHTTSEGEARQPLSIDLEKDFEPSGQETRIGDCLRAAAKDLRGIPLAGVVVISDGRQNAGEDPVHVAASQFRNQRIPIFTVSVGDPGEPKDIEIAVEGPEAILPDDPTEAIAYIRQKGYDALGSLDVEMREGDKVIKRQAGVKLGKAGEKIAVPLKFSVAKPGKYTYSLSVPKQAGELREENNEASYTFQVVDKKVKVLFVEGQDLPRWEYRFLKNALVRDHTTEADCLLASGEGTFLWDGTPGKATLETFPNTKKEMGEYDVVILGDVNPVIFTTDQIKLLLDFVREGGGFIMIAGERFAPGAYLGGALAELLPVVPHPGAYVPPEGGFQDQFPIELTVKGKQMPWTQLDAEDSANRETWERLPKQMWFYPVKRSKVIADIIAVHPFAKDDEGKKTPLIATMQVGAGRSMYIGVDSLWRWRREFGDRYHYRFYSQAIRHLSTAKRLGGQKRFLLGADKNIYSIGDQVPLTALLKDEKFNPLTTDHVTVYVQGPKNKTQTVELKRRRDLEGNYEGTFYPNEKGDYNLWLKDEHQPEIHQSEISLKVDFPQLELENPRMHEELLRALAAAGGEGGRYVTIDRLGQIPPLISPKEENVLHEKPINLWDNWLVLALFTLLITLEWVLRKKGRMI